EVAGSLPFPSRRPSCSSRLERQLSSRGAVGTSPTYGLSVTLARDIRFNGWCYDLQPLRQTMRSAILCSAALVFFAYSSAIAQERAEAKKPAPTEPKHLTIAKQLVAHLDLANTDYEHGTPSVKFTAPYESHADCSGFADALLQYSYGLDKDQFRKIFGSGRPSAKRYHDAIEE